MQKLGNNSLVNNINKWSFVNCFFIYFRKMSANAYQCRDLNSSMLL